MKLSTVLFALALLVSTNTKAQFEFLNNEHRPFSNPNSGFDFEDLKNTTLLVEKYEETGINCENKPIYMEVGFSIVPVVYFCPDKKMSKKQKKDVLKWNGKLNKNLEIQSNIWQEYTNEYQLVSSKEIASEDYADTGKFRFVLRYKYVSASPGNGNVYFAHRYFLYDRKKEVEYATLASISTTTDLKKLSNLKKVVGKLQEN